jgi:chromosome segregation ATPase
MGIRRIFGKSAELDSLPAELKGVLEDMRRERSAFEAGLVRAAELTRSAEALSTSLRDGQQALEQLHAQLAEAGGVVEQLRSVKTQLDALAAGSQETGRQLEEASRLAARARTEAVALRPQLEVLEGLRNELPGLLEQVAPVRELDDRVRVVSARTKDVGTRQQALEAAISNAAERLAGVEERFGTIGGDIAGVTTRMERFEQTAADLRQLTTDAPTLRRELGTLKALAELVSQKLAALEGQRAAVDRATRRAEGLTELIEQVNRQVAEQQTNAKFLTALEERVAQLKQLHEALLVQTSETRRRQAEIEGLVRVQREGFESARTAMQDALSGFAFEREGLAAVHQRVQDLRETLKAVEERLPSLDATRAGLAEAEAAAQRLTARVAALGEEVTQVEASAEALGPLRQEIGRVQGEVGELVRRAEGAARPALAELEETERRVAELNEAIEGLAARTGQTEGQRAMLAGLAREIAARQSALDRAAAQLDRSAQLRAEATELGGRLDKELEGLRTRLVEAGELASRTDGQLMQFEERSRRLADEGTRLAALERRFAGMLEAAEKMERAVALLATRQASLDAVRDDLTRVFGVADATVERARTVAALQKEIEQRHQAIEELTDRLRALDRYGERLDTRQAQFAEAEHQLQSLDAHLADLKATLGTVLEQRAFLEKAVEATGALTFQTLHAESILAQLRSEGRTGGPGPGREPDAAGD